METLKSMLEKLTKLSRECRYLEAKPGLDEGLKKVLWKHNGEMEMLHMFAHQLAREVCPDMMITYDDVTRNSKVLHSPTTNIFFINAE